MPTVTAMVLTRNEEEILGRCLSRLTWADEMLVIDSLSTDRTREIALGMGARVVEHPFAGFASQVNFGFEQAKSDWILMVDADEMVTPKLRDSVLAAVNGQPAFEIYDVRRDAYVFGKRIKATSWSREWIPRLSRKGSLSFTGVVHPKPEYGGRKTGRLDGVLLHYTYRSVAKYFEKFESYSSLWAEKAWESGRRVSLFTIVYASFWRFFHNYFIRGEIFDGRMGFLLSALAGAHTFVRSTKLWGLEHAEEIARIDDAEE